MTYTLDQLLNLDPNVFGNMKKKELKEIMEQLKQAKKERTKQFITPVIKDKVKPIQDKWIKPLKEEHIKPIDKVIKDLKTFLPKKDKSKKAYLTINGKRYGPLTKQDFIDMITEVEDEEEK